MSEQDAIAPRRKRYSRRRLAEKGFREGGPWIVHLSENSEGFATWFFQGPEGNQLEMSGDLDDQDDALRILRVLNRGER